MRLFKQDTEVDALKSAPLFQDLSRKELVQLARVSEDLEIPLEFPGGGQLELIAFKDVPEQRLDEAPVRVGHGHVCFEIDDLEAAIATVEALGARRIGR